MADDPPAYPAAGVVARLAQNDERGISTVGHPADGLGRGDGSPGRGWLGVLRHGAAQGDLVTRLDTVRAERIPLLLEELRPTRNALRNQLMKKRELVESDSEARLAISLVYLPDDSREVNFLVERLHVADAEELKVIRDELKSHQPEAATRRCWRCDARSNRQEPPATSRRGALAVLDPHNVAWQVQAHDVAAAMIQETPARQWTDLFRPVESVFDGPPSNDLQRPERAPRQAQSSPATSWPLSSAPSTPMATFIPTSWSSWSSTPTPSSSGLCSPSSRISPTRTGRRRASSYLVNLKSEPDDHAWARHLEVAEKRLYQELGKEAQPNWNDIEFKNESWPESTIVEQLENARGMCKDRFAFCQTLALGDFHRLASDLEPCGYRPICVRPYSAEGKVLVAAAWIARRTWLEVRKGHDHPRGGTEEQGLSRPMGELRQRILAGRHRLLLAAAPPRLAGQALLLVLFRRSSHGTRRSGSRLSANRTAG